MTGEPLTEDDLSAAPLTLGARPAPVDTPVSLVQGSALPPTRIVREIKRVQPDSRGLSYQTAVRLASEHGIPVFPCNQNKTPRTEHGFKDASTDLEAINRWFLDSNSLVAVPTGDRFFVVDIDPKGLVWYQQHANQLNCGCINETRRGRHLLYAVPKGVTIANSAGKLASGVDVRGNGGYVIWWPADGLPSTGGIENIGPPPQWLLDLIVQADRTQRADGHDHDADAGKDCISEGCRNSELTRIAGKLRRDGLSPAEIEAALIAINAKRCRPTLPDQEVRSIAASAERWPPGKPDAAWPAPIDLVALARTPPQPPPMIIQDWLPAGYATLIAGHGGIGKSGIALHLAACIATGKLFYGLAVAQHKVLYLSCEDRQDVLHWRLARICEYHDIDMEALAGRLDLLDLVGHETLLWHKPDSTQPRAYALLQQAIVGHDVIFLDGIADVYGGNENARAEVKAFCNSMVALIPPHGAVILIGHVNRQTAAGNGGEPYAGTTGWHNSVRGRWSLMPEKGDEGAQSGDLILQLQKSNLGASGHKIRLAWDPDAHMYVGELVRATTRMGRETADLAEQTGITDALTEVISAGDYCPAATSGPPTALHVLSARPTFPKTLTGVGGRRRFWRHIESLRAMGKIREGSIRRKDRHLVATLELVSGPDIDTRACGQ
jgi:hypothetical protein